MFLYAAMEGLARRDRPEGKLDEGLLPRVGQGDTSALEALYVQTERAVYALALSILRDPEEAQDVTQEVYLKVRAAAHLYVPQGKPLAWLFTITKNLCRDVQRTRGRTDQAPEGLEDDARFSYVSDPTDRLVLEAALKALGDEERQVVLLHAVSGLKHREIAQDLGLPLSTVLSRYNRALKKLKRYLTEEGIRL
ncbi:RNA polymerase sigma factor [uncultured Intestinimonas sp.]|uniref:RNA polymerase sigma factor n=1 Tax=uncultured Intestinimonas sp. TaxID=1689265 RepID=UPI0025F569DC|nr:RNA polymerase sigma factor [uncultured Intestinimonas sp.]